MDPITFSILLCLAIGFSAKAAGGGIAHAAAGIRGEPSPTVQKWKAKENARRAEGLPPRRRPKSILGTAWQNAVEEWAVKSEQKHHGRIEALRELGPTVSARAKKRLLWRANLRAKLADKAAGWSGASRDRLMRISSDIRETIDRNAANRASGELDEGLDAEVIPFPGRGNEADDGERFFGALPGTWCPVRGEEGHLYGDLPDGTHFCLACELEKTSGQGTDSDQENQQDQPSRTWCPLLGDYLPEGTQFCASCKGHGGHATSSDQESSSGQESNTTGGNQDMATATEETVTLPEPTTLPTAIQYADTVGAHLGRLGDKVAEDAAVFANNADALKVQVAAIETGQESLSALGFRSGTIQDGLAKAAELAPAAAEKLRELEALSQEVGEQLQEIRDAMRSVSGALKAQQSLADEAQSHHARGGTADRTEFYREG